MKFEKFELVVMSVSLLEGFKWRLEFRYVRGVGLDYWVAFIGFF